MRKTLNSENIHEIGARLLELRKKLGLSQKELAEKLGMKSYQSLQTYEKGYIEPPLAVVTGIALLSGVSTDWILMGDMSRGICCPPGTVEHEILSELEGLPEHKKRTSLSIIKTIKEDGTEK
jgi:transcriptional regulator with XRE-family HTH domain